ncbi:copper resistance protein CopC [Micromonospora sp. NBC_00898]|uniref:copper resistance CopC family protein n=1 Tax=Micromonospora sp. NBC_00898 TaxID=2975981 RepID=UPI00386783F0|nr:copper resistance protein CopC [Micromonospora sp. NBC_00898]
MRPPSRPAARIAGAVLAAVMALLISATPAWAHNSLRAATPAQDARLTAPPTEITLEFVQRLDPTFTTIVLTDPARRKVPTGAPAVDGVNGAVAIAQPLGNGTYTVAYRVVSADGHPVQGSYQFTVADPTATANPAAATATAPVSDPATPAPTTAAASSADVEKNGTVVLIAGVVLAALVVTAGVLLRRRTVRR